MEVKAKQTKGQYICLFQKFAFNSAEYTCSIHFIFSYAVEQEKLAEMKRVKECRSDEKLASKRSTNDSEVQSNKERQTNQEEPSSVSPVPSPVKSGSSPVSPVSSHSDQVRTTLSSSSPSKKSRCLHYTSIYCKCRNFRGQATSMKIKHLKVCTGKELVAGITAGYSQP